MKIFIASILVLLSLFATGQQNRFNSIDEKISQMGAMPNENLATITENITHPFFGKEEKARAIYYWITHHITIDPKATKRNDQRKIKPEEIIQLRATTPLGFSLLFQEMCSQANIRCLSVDGYTRNNVDDIGNPPEEINHSWNVVQLGQGPDAWFYVDAAKGSGSLDKRMTTFIPNFNSNYFFTNPEVFNMDHYPDNEAWRLGIGPKSLSAFNALPVIYSYGNALGINKTEPKTGKIKTKTTSTVKFNLFHTPNLAINEMKIVIGEDKRAEIPREIKFTDESGIISFSYSFKRGDEYPVTIFADGKPIISYYVISEE